YTDLFRLYQEQQKLGEHYELLLCFGLLTWKTPTQERVQRHLIVTEAALSFEPSLKRLTAYQTSQMPRIELDMLSPDEQPQDTYRLIQDCQQAIEGNLRKKKKLTRCSAPLPGLCPPTLRGNIFPTSSGPETGQRHRSRSSPTPRP
ncbi:MAG: hypothetical protein D3904_17935, partial [Candidatus Electrothrix sp. EH2]|nr:hypothetical protein [Candidatus Electrothrix sp. EH2]